MKAYVLNESEMRRLTEIEFMFDVLVGDDPDLWDAERLVKAALREEGYPTFDAYIDAQMARRHPMEV